MFFLFTVPLWAVPIIWLLTVLRRKNQREMYLLTVRQCPSCAEMVKREAIVCRHCGRDLPVLACVAEGPAYPPVEYGH